MTLFARSEVRRTYPFAISYLALLLRRVSHRRRLCWLKTFIRQMHFATASKRGTQKHWYKRSAQAALGFSRGLTNPQPRPVPNLVLDSLLREASLPRETTMEVYLLQHVHEFPDGEEDIKLIGVYSSRVLAEEAQRRAEMLPGFHETPKGFTIDPYKVNEDHWPEGYITDTHEDLLRRWTQG